MLATVALVILASSEEKQSFSTSGTYVAPHVVSVTSNGLPSGSFTNANPIIFTFTLTQSTSTFSLSSIDPLVNCIHPVFTNKGNGVYTLSCNTQTGNQVGVAVAPWSYTSATGLIDEQGYPYYFLFSDLVPPVLTVSTPLTGSVAGYSCQSPLTIDMTSPKAIVGLTQSDIITTGCQSPEFTAISEYSYRLTCVTQGNDGNLITLSIPPNSYQDLASSYNTVWSNLSVISDTVAPTLQIWGGQDGTIADGSVVHENPIYFQFYLSEPSVNFDFNDVDTLEYCNGATFSGSGAQYTVTCAQNVGAAVAVGVGNHDFTDLAGNVNQVGVPYFYLISQAASTPSPTTSLGASHTPSPTIPTWSPRPSYTPSPSITPSPSVACEIYNYSGPFNDSYVLNCAADNCVNMYLNLTAAEEACTLTPTCGGITYTIWNEQLFNQSLPSFIYQLRAANYVSPSPDGEISWLKANCLLTEGTHAPA